MRMPEALLVGLDGGLMHVPMHGLLWVIRCLDSTAGPSVTIDFTCNTSWEF